MKKAQDRLKALQQRAGSYANPTAHPAEESPAEAVDHLAQAHAYFGVEPLDRLTRDRAIEALPVTQIAPDLRPECRQPRLLPLPATLSTDGQPTLAYADLVAELLDLGRSLQRRQLQPIIVYPGTSEAFPEARYLILIGHRRWTASILVGMATISAVIVHPPDAVERVSVQYAENEDRADFSDMERAWALLQMKQALGDVPWEVVEERFRLSRSRRQDLLRLLVLTETQQREVARLRLSETQLRPLHTALRSGELTHAHADMVLNKIARSPVAPDTPIPSADGPTIARLIMQAKRSVARAGTDVRPPSAPPQWLTALDDQLKRTEKSLQRAERRVRDLHEGEATALVVHLLALSLRMAELAETLKARAGDGQPLDESESRP